MYHQFADKAALFRDVVEVVEQDVMARMATLVAASGRRRRPMQSGQRSMPGSRYLVIRRCVSWSCWMRPSCWAGRVSATSPSDTAWA